MIYGMKYGQLTYPTAVQEAEFLACDPPACAAVNQGC